MEYVIKSLLLRNVKNNLSHVLSSNFSLSRSRSVALGTLKRELRTVLLITDVTQLCF